MMDKSCNLSGDSTTNTCSSSSSGVNNRDRCLKHVNKISLKISKPSHGVRKSTFDEHHQPSEPQREDQDQTQTQSQPQHMQQQQQQQNQPPVYNINKSDFRDVVQKLTGSPAHERFSTPPPIQPPKPPSSRLQRIRPPPLAQFSNRPPPMLISAALPPNPNNPTYAATNVNFTSSQRPIQPLSPLPPFPSVHAAAESPISAYMRFLQSSISAVDSDPKRYSGLLPLAPLASPRWNNLAQTQPPQYRQQNIPPSITSAPMALPQFPMPPSSPLPFGCLPSPRSPYPLLFSPTGQFGFQQLPLSPTLPVTSPTWKGL
ncbi:unnamed protein product [Ilex paraguariensis]|uniref:VQ domain-containing protein n=1 Tax=Ilex paraguariensis TaxID=185542 RepID=A0ABC8S218_9AQUA